MFTETVIAAVSAVISRYAPRRGVALTVVCGFALVVAVAVALRGFASALLAAHAVALLVLASVRHYVATRPNRHFPNMQTSLETAQRRAIQMTQWSRLTTMLAMLLLAQQAWIVFFAGKWSFSHAAAAGLLVLASIFADICALTNQRAIAPRLIEATRMRKVAETAVRRSGPLRDAFNRSDGVVQPPLVLTITSGLAIAACLGSLIASAGIKQMTLDEVPRLFSGKKPATGRAPTAPPAAPSPTAPQPASPTPSVSAQQECGRGYDATIKGAAPPPVAEALVLRFNRISPTVLGCPLGSSRMVGRVWVLEAGRDGRRLGLVIATPSGEANAVPAPRDALVMSLAEKGALTAVGPVRSTGSGDYQFTYLMDSACAVTLRRVFRDHVVYLPPAVARIVVDASVSRYRFPYVAAQREENGLIFYVVKFEYSRETLELTYDPVRQEVLDGPAAVGQVGDGCANRAAFDRLADDFQRKYLDSLNSSRSRRRAS